METGLCHARCCTYAPYCKEACSLVGQDGQRGNRTDTERGSGLPTLRDLAVLG